MDRQPYLTLHKGDATANVRMDYVNKGTMTAYFDLLKNVLRENKLMESPNQIYNVHETGNSSARPLSAGLSHGSSAGPLSAGLSSTSSAAAPEKRGAGLDRLSTLTNAACATQHLRRTDLNALDQSG